MAHGAVLVERSDFRSWERSLPPPARVTKATPLPPKPPPARKGGGKVGGPQPAAAGSLHGVPRGTEAEPLYSWGGSNRGISATAARKPGLPARGACLSDSAPGLPAI